LAMPGKEKKAAPNEEEDAKPEETAEVRTDKPKDESVAGSEPKFVPAPDEKAFSEATAGFMQTISDSHARLEKIKSMFEKADKDRSGTRSAEQALKDKSKGSRSAIGAAITEYKGIQAELQAADEARKSWQTESAKLNKGLKFKSTQEIDDAVKRLEYQMTTTSMSVTEEKKILAEINTLNKSKKEVKMVEDCQEAIRSQKENADALHQRLKAKNAEISEMKAADKKVQDELEALKSKHGGKEFNAQALKKEENELRAKIRESHQKVKVLKDEHMKKVNEYRKYQKRLYELRQVERKKEWEARQEEKKKRSDEFKEEYADILKDPYWKEQFELDDLVTYLTQLMPAKKDGAAEKVETAVSAGTMDGMEAMGKRDDDEVGFIGKKKGKKGPRAPVERDEKIKHSLDAFASFSKHKLEAPSFKSEVQAALDAVNARKEYLKTAPPPEKKEKKEKGEKGDKGGDKKEKKEAPEATAVEVKVTATSGSTADVEIKVNEEPTPAEIAPPTEMES